jgi:putative transposase
MRKRRILRNGAIYHVIARANRNEFILNRPMKDELLDVIRRARKRWDFNITNFCFMSNHIHLMISPRPGENLSRIMQWILSVFAVRFNKVFGYKGHVWYDRFKSKIVGSLRQFIQTFSYISNNPIKAEIVRHACEYRYSGVFHIRNGDYTIVDPPGAVIRLLADEYHGLLQLG